MLASLIAFFFFFLPFQFALNPSESIDLPLARLFILIIFFFWLARGLLKKTFSLPPPLFTGSLLSFLFLGAVSLLWASNTDFALRKLFFLLNFFLLVFPLYDLGRGKGVLQKWIRALLAGGSLAALLGIGLFLTQFVLGIETVFLWLTQTLPFFLGENLGNAVAQYPSLLVNVAGQTLLRTTALFPDPHVASFYFGMTGFLALGFFLQEKKKIFLFGAMLLFLADLLTFSRGGYLGLAVGAIVFLALSWTSLEQKIKRNISILGLTLIILFFFFGQPILSRFISSFSLSDTSSMDRIVLWQEAWANIEERPWLGTGLGNYILAVDPTATYRIPYYAHNLYLDITTELGLVGLFFFLLMIGLSYSQILKPAWPVGRNMRMNRQYFLNLGLLSSLTLYAIHSLFETALYSVHILPLLLFILAVALVQNKPFDKLRVKKKADAVA